MNIPVIPFWLKIVGPIVLLIAIVGGVMLWGAGKYRAGHRDGVTETDAKWEEASAKLKADAAKSATRADDKAAAKLEEYVAAANEDAAAVEKANQEGRSPLDALFN